MALAITRRDGAGAREAYRRGPSQKGLVVLVAVAVLLGRLLFDRPQRSRDQRFN